MMSLSGGQAPHIAAHVAAAREMTGGSPPTGRTDIDYAVVREGKNLKGRVLAIVLGTVGKGVLGQAFENAVKAIEARSAAGTPAALP